jgi:hypothetical protein
MSDVASIKKHVKTILKNIPEEGFQKCCEQWKCLLTKCVAVQGDCFECDRNY